jgi:hypothetical protein
MELGEREKKSITVTNLITFIHLITYFFLHGIINNEKDVLKNKKTAGDIKGEYPSEKLKDGKPEIIVYPQNKLKELVILA